METISLGILVPVVGPEHDIGVNYLTVPLSGHSSPLQTGGFEVVFSQHLDSSPEGQVMQLICIFQGEEIINGKEVQDSSM